MVGAISFRPSQGDVADQNQGRILGLSPGVLGELPNSSKRSGGQFVPVLPHRNKHQALGDRGRRRRRTTSDSGMVYHGLVVGKGEPFKLSSVLKEPPPLLDWMSETH